MNLSQRSLNGFIPLKEKFQFIKGKKHGSMKTKTGVNFWNKTEIKENVFASS